MKKVVVLMLTIVTILTASKTTYATTTFSLDKSLGGDGATYRSGGFDGNSRDVDAISFTYLKKIKFDIEYLSGKYIIDESSLDLKCSNIQIGYRLLNYPKELLYITLGEIKYSESTEATSLSTHEADGGMIGINFVGILSNKFQIELNLQKSLDVSSEYKYYDLLNFNYVTINSAAELIIKEIKLRYLLTDNLGLTISYYSMHLDIEDTSSGDIALKFCSMGLVYRF